MPLPGNLTTVTVTGQYMRPDGVAESGTVSFTPSNGTYIRDASAGAIIVPETISVDLDGTGALSVVLPATDDPDASPVGFTYDVAETIAGGKFKRTYSVQLPSADTTVDLAELAPVQPAGASVLLVTSVNGKGPSALGAVTLVPGDIGAATAADVVSLDSRVDTLEANAGSDVALRSTLGQTSTVPFAEFATAGIQSGVTLTTVSTSSPPTGITWDGSQFKINQPGVYEALYFGNNPLLIPVYYDVVLRNCKFEATSDHSVPAVTLPSNDNFVRDMPRRRIVEHCEFSGPWASGVSVAGGTVRNCLFKDLKADAVNPGRSPFPTVIVGNVAKDFLPSNGSHVDGIQIIEVPAGPLLIEGNWIAAENKSGRPYSEVNPETGYTSAVFIECTIAPSSTDPWLGVTDAPVIIRNNYLSASQAYNVVKIKPKTGVRVILEGNVIRKPLDAAQDGITGTWFDEDTEYLGGRNIDAVSGTAIDFKLYSGVTERPFERVLRHELLHGDIGATWDADECETTQSLTSNLCYVVVQRVRKPVRGKKLRAWVTNAGTVSAAAVGVYLGTKYNYLQKIATASGAGILAASTTAPTEIALTLASPPYTLNPLGAADTSGDVVAEPGDLLAYVVSATSSAAPALLAHLTQSAAVANRGGVWVAATKSIAPGSLPADFDLTDGSWTAANAILWFALTGGYPS